MAGLVTLKTPKACTAIHKWGLPSNEARPITRKKADSRSDLLGSANPRLGHRVLNHLAAQLPGEGRCRQGPEGVLRRRLSAPAGQNGRQPKGRADVFLGAYAMQRVVSTFGDLIQVFEHIS